MAWFRYFKSNETISSATPNYNYSYPYCKRFINRFTPRDTLEIDTWIFANISDININKYKNISLQDETDQTSYVVTYEKGENVYPVETVIESNYLYFKTYEKHTAAEEIIGQYAIYYNTPNLRKINEVDNGGVEDYQVNLAPVWEDLELAPFIYGDSYLDGPSAIGTVYSISSGALPTGLSINSSTGQISGTVNSSGAYSFTARATTDDGKYYNEASFSGTIYEYLEWVDSTLANIDYNTAYSNSVWADGYPAATYSISSGTLPSGITLNSTTGLVSGTTTASGAYSFTVKAENAIGSITQSFSGTVQTPPSLSDQTLGAIIQGVSYSDGVSATGTATITYSVYSGSLPSGLSLNSSTGAITGTTGSTGSYSFTIRATNTWGYAEKTFAGTIYTAPAWTDSTIANMIYGQAYNDAVAASGYPAVTYSISTGALPSGITLNSSTGAITGTSTTAGSYSFTVKAENAAGNVTQLFTDDLYVTPAWTDNTLAALTYNTAYSDGVVATGSPTYTISSGTLPTGLSLNSSTGAVTGTPTYYGAYSFTIQAANETGSVTQSFSGGINKAPTWDDETLADAVYDTAYSDSLSTLSYPVSTFSVTSGSLPTGLTLSSSGTLSGTSTATGNHSFTITATNSEGSISKSFSFNVNRVPTWNDETLATPTYNTVYSDGVSSNAAYPAVTYSISAGSLPSEFSINSSTGAITGTYTTPVNGSSFSYTFTVKAENTAGNVTKEFTWSIAIPFTYSGGTSYSAGTGYTGVYFTANGTFEILSGARDIQFAVVGGGGGGGGTGRNTGRNNIAYGGGGGGAEFLQTTITALTVGNYAITVGAGGVGGSPTSGTGPPFYTGSTGGNGSQSRVFSGATDLITANGGSPGTGGTGGGSTTETIGGYGGNYSPSGYDGGIGFILGVGTNRVSRGGGGAGINDSGTDGLSNSAGEPGGGYTSPGSGGWTLPGVSFGGYGGNNTAIYQYPYAGTGGNGSVGYASGSTGISGYVYLRWLT